MPSQKSCDQTRGRAAGCTACVYVMVAMSCAVVARNTASWSSEYFLQQRNLRLPAWYSLTAWPTAAGGYGCARRVNLPYGGVTRV